MADRLDIPVAKGEIQLNLKLPKPVGFDYQVVKPAAQELKMESVILTEENAAKNTLGTTVTTSVEGRFAIENNGDLIKNSQTNSQALEWIVVDFHKERLINEIALTVKENPTEQIDFVVKIWGGTIFFATSPQVKGSFSAPPPQPPPPPQTVQKRFAEQMTEKALIEFGLFDADGNFINDKSLIVVKLKIKAFGFPANLSLRIGDQPPFFTHPGELASGVLTTVPDFSKEINTFLENTVPEDNGSDLLIPLILTSTSDGIVSFKMLQNGNINPINTDITNLGFGLEGFITRFFDRADTNETVEQVALDFDGSSPQPIYLTLPPQVTITEADFQIRGSLSKEQLLLDNVNGSQRLGVLGSGDFLLAQSFRLDAERDIAAFTLLIEFSTDEVELSVAIHPDFQNQPGATALPESVMQFQFPLLGKFENINSPTLVRIDLPAAIRLNAGQYWIVLTTTKGKITWRINDIQPNLGGFVFSRLDGPVNWMARKHPATREPVSGCFKIHSIAQDAVDLIRISIGNTEGLVAGIESPSRIDQQTTTLVVKDREKKLVDLLNDVPVKDRIPIIFSTLAHGSLEVSNLRIKFVE